MSGLEGLGSAKKNLEVFAEKAKSKRKPALEAGAVIIVNEARRRVRVDTHDLQRSIEKETVVENDEEVVTVVGPNAPYGRRIELGFTGTDSLGRTYNQPPYPYLRPAYEENKDRVEKEVAEVFQILTEKL